MVCPSSKGKAEFGALYPEPVKWCSAPTKIALDGDVLISVRAPVGPTNIANRTSCIGRGLAALRAKDGVHPKYVLYGMRATSDVLASKATGSTFSAVSGAVLREHKLPVPSFPEQQQIVAAIETHFARLDDAVAALERARTRLKRYRASVLKAACEGRLVPTEAELARQEGRAFEPASVLLERIAAEREAKTTGKRTKTKDAPPIDTSNLLTLPEGWACTTLASIADIKGGITKGQRRKEGEIVRAVPYLRVANVQRGYLDLNEVKLIEAQEQQIQELRLQPGDVLFNEGGDRDKLGRGWIWQGQIGECIHQNHVFRARLLNDQIEPKYISWYGNTFGQRYFIDQGKQTTNLASINLTKLGGLPVPLPPLGEQERIVTEVERLMSITEQMEATVETNLKRAASLRQSILRLAFSGRLVRPDTRESFSSGVEQLAFSTNGSADLGQHA